MANASTRSTIFLTLLAAALASCGGEASVEVRSSGRGSPTLASVAAASPTPRLTTAPNGTPSPTVTRPPVTATATPALRTPTPSPSPSATRQTSSPSPTATPTTPLGPTKTPTDRPTRTATSSTASTATPNPTGTGTFSPTVTPTGTMVSTAAPTPTLTSLPTEPPTATPGAGGAVCGNGFLEAGENYLDPAVGPVGDPDGQPCPEDAVVQTCEPTDPRAPFDVVFMAPTGTAPSSLTVLVGYRSDLVSLPGSGTAVTVRQRISTPPPPPFVQTPNDLDYALRFILARTSAIGNGTLFSISFDTCSGAAMPAANQFGCYVEGCAGAGGRVRGCTCAVSASVAP